MKAKTPLDKVITALAVIELRRNGNAKLIPHELAKYDNRTLLTMAISLLAGELVDE